MKHEISLTRFPVAGFAQDRGVASGALPLSGFARLTQESHSLAATEPVVPVTYAVSAEMRDTTGADVPWMQLQAATVLRLTCQRCLGEVDVPVDFDRSFRFVASEELAQAEDEVSEEDVLVLSKQFDLQELIEDELLMAMPLVPMHEVCPKPVRLQAADADFDSTPAERPNPFAVLDKLKGGAG